MLFFSFLLGFLGWALGCVFSGSETAFYRASKLRFKLDALDGDRTANKLLWFFNNPGLFVATLLVGNNVANYAVSMATVLFVAAIISDSKGIFVEIASTLILAPFLFVYGEVFPKNLCLQIPTKMLRLFSPVLFFAFSLFLPITAFLWGFNKFITTFLGKTNDFVTTTLGRQELSGILDEGKKTGVLFDAQRKLANGLFQHSQSLIRELTTPMESIPFVKTDMKPEAVLDLMRQSRLTELPVYDADAKYPTPELPLGFVRAIDLELAVRNQLDEQSRQLLQLLQTELPIRSMVEIAAKYSYLTALILLQTMHCSFGCVVDERRHCIGFISADKIQSALLSA